MTEWNAASYHKVSGPQTSWGQKVLNRLQVNGDERAIDAGCGSGRLTGDLMERLPNGRLIAIDRSWNMLMTARANLRPVLGSRVSFVQVSLPDLPFAGWADLVFSTATFHWVLDHERLFRSLFAALVPGGRLVAQCGGGPNLERQHQRAAALMRLPSHVAHFAQWTEPWEFADADTTRARLAAAGFTDIATRVTAAPVVQPDRAAFVEFVTHVIFRPHLARLPDTSRRTSVVEELASPSAGDAIPFELDYWRLEFDATRPR